MNVESESDLFGRPLNPYDPERAAGGSSGGAAAALAAAHADVGTDLSGSVRMPAHFCGVLGLKRRGRTASAPAAMSRSRDTAPERHH